MGKILQNINKWFKRDESFTLIEMLVAMTIFVFVMVLGSSIFVMAIRDESNAVVVQSAEDSLRYSLEEMARNLRTSTLVGTSIGGCPNNSGSYPTGANGSGPFNEIHLYNNDIATSAAVGNTCYYLNNQAHQIQETVPSLNIQSLALTSTKIQIQNLSFYVTGFGSSAPQAKVTILVNLAIPNSTICSSSNPCLVQTTISLRNLNH